MNPILSIIVPSYKTKQYLSYTLPTFVDDRLMGKISVLLIDDGSPDDTLEALREWESQYPDIFICHHKENGGHGSVINCGVDFCDTRYFMVVDGDDYVNTEAFIELVDKLYECNEDVVAFNFCTVSMDGSIRKQYNYIKDEQVLVSQGKSLFGRFHVGISYVAYRADLWKSHHISLTEHCFYEDHQYALFPFAYIKTARCIPLSIYRYVLGDHEQSVAPARLNTKKGDIIKVIDGILDFTKREDALVIDYEEVALRYTVSLIEMYLDIALSYEKSFFRSWYAMRCCLQKYRDDKYQRFASKRTTRFYKNGFLAFIYYRVRYRLMHVS